MTPQTAEAPVMDAQRAPAGCTARTARCANARDYGARLAECCRGHVIGLVREVGALMSDAGVTWWADYGTLLGAVRNPLTTWADYPWLAGEGPIAPGIVPHDKDADLGVLASDWPKVVRLRPRLMASGHSVSVRSHGSSIKVRLSHRNSTNVDLFFWRERENGTLYRRRYIGVDQYKGKDIDPALLFPLSSVEWEDLILPAPRDPEAFLAFRYGPSWMTPLRANHDGVRR